MKNKYATEDNLVFHDRKKAGHKFWLWAVTLYAVVQAAYWVLEYFTIYNNCTSCLHPLVYYIFHWMMNVVFAACLWLILNSFYYKKRWLVITLNAITFLTSSVLWILSKYNLHNHAPEWLIGKSAKAYFFRDVIYDSWYYIGQYVLTATAFYMLKFYKVYKKAAEQRIQMAVINKDMQLNLLKQQLSPHFYFNTLNNLYGLAKANSSKLSGALQQLQNIMQYVLTECSQAKVLLQKEIDFLQSYIALEKLRYEKDIIIEIKVNGKAIGHNILPLLLIQFVENAFKHGMKEKSYKNWMQVKVTIEENELIFTVNNSCHTSTFTEGLGLSSVKHRLALMYAGKHEMRIMNANNEFAVFLKLNL